MARPTISRFSLAKTNRPAYVFDPNEPEPESAPKPKKSIRQLEARLQTQCVNWFELQYGRHFRIFAVPNGGARNPKEAKNLKSSGVRAGVPDLMIPVLRKGYGGLFIEMKSEKNRATTIQTSWHDYLEGQGYKVIRECRSYDEFVRHVTEYLGPPGKRMFAQHRDDEGDSSKGPGPDAEL